MGKQKDLKIILIKSIINFVRENHKEAIDKAYEYFWDENYPEEFLDGTALSLGFINFEDWLVFDYKANDDKETFIDIFLNCTEELKDNELILLNNIKNSVLSMYEVTSVSKDRGVKLKDLLLDGKYELIDKTLSRGLKKGNVFAARLLTIDSKTVMSGCVYPYSASEKKTVLGYIDKQFKRYIRDEKPDGKMNDYLKDYGDIFNLIWMQFILDRHAGKG
jgi:hypothetical protein